MKCSGYSCRIKMNPDSFCVLQTMSVSEFTDTISCFIRVTWAATAGKLQLVGSPQPIRDSTAMDTCCGYSGRELSIGSTGLYRKYSIQLNFILFISTSRTSMRHDLDYTVIMRRKGNILCSFILVLDRRLIIYCLSTTCLLCCRLWIVTGNGLLIEFIFFSWCSFSHFYSNMTLYIVFASYLIFVIGSFYHYSCIS